MLSLIHKINCIADDPNNDSIELSSTPSDGIHINITPSGVGNGVRTNCTLTERLKFEWKCNFCTIYYISKSKCRYGVVYLVLELTASRLPVSLAALLSQVTKNEFDLTHDAVPSSQGPKKVEDTVVSSSHVPLNKSVSTPVPLTNNKVDAGELSQERYRIFKFH